MRWNHPGVANAQPLWIAAAVSTLCAGLTFGEVVAHVEDFATSASGWTGSGAYGMTVTHSIEEGLPAGSMKGEFASQDVPVPGSGAFRANAEASGGAFTGNYWAEHSRFYGWTFHFRAEDVLPSLLQVRFNGGGHTFFANVLPQVTGPGQWFTVAAPTVHAGAWFGGTAVQWSNALADVQWVEVVVGRNGAGAQTYRMDNFDNNLPTIRESAIGDRVWFDTNGNGIQDAGETIPIRNLPVALMDETTNAVLAETQTDENGLYRFEELAASNYVVRFAFSGEPGLMPTLAKQGGDAAVDSDASAGAPDVLYAWTDPIALGVAATNLTVDFGMMARDGTRAELAAVWGEWADDEARVAWHTRSEWNTAGFHVYRVHPETGEEQQLNERLVASVFPKAGAFYELADAQAHEGDAGIYRIEEVELSGRVRDRGRHEVVFGAPPALVLKARARMAAVEAARNTRTAEPLSAPRAPGPAAVLKVRVTEEGLHGLSLERIARGMGLGVEHLRALAADGMLSLTCRGEPVPVIWDAVRNRLVFHAGPPAPNAWTRETPILIRQGQGTAMPRREPAATTGETLHTVRRRFEQDLHLGKAALPVMPDYNYYWNSLVGTTSTLLGWRNFALDLSGHDGGALVLKVRLLGWTCGPKDPDHRAEFRFNQTVVGALEFDGQEVATAVLAIPAGLAVDGANTLSVKNMLLPGRSYSTFVVDWIEAEYRRRLPSGTGTTHILAESAESFSATTLREPVVMALDAEQHPTWIATASGGLSFKSWRKEAGDVRYAVAEASGIPELTPEAATAEAWFMAASNRLDYLIIAPRVLASAAQELADYRAGQGLRAGVAILEEVCDLLGHAERTPEAVRRLLVHARETWAEAPWMVVLAGSGHADYLGLSGTKPGHIPPMLVRTCDGLCAADGLMADTDGDRRPDVALGRLPAQTPEDLTAMIAKIRAYEAQFGASWQEEIVLVSDAADSGNDFGPATDRLAGLVEPPEAVVDRIEVDAMGLAVAGGRLIDWLQAGLGFIHFTGHGGVENLGAGQLLTVEDVAELENVGAPPVLVALSCLAARFDEPGTDCLGEALLRKEDGGAVAVLGPSGLSRNEPAARLGEAFFRAVWQERIGTLGLAFMRARQSVNGSAHSEETFAVYNLLGDPALRIAGNKAGGSPESSYAQWRWQRYAPGELMASGGRGEPERFAEYAMGANGGLSLSKESSLAGIPGFVLTWQRRIHRQDIDYRIRWSEDLRQWTRENPEDLETIAMETDPDGAMETVRTRVGGGNAPRLFLGIEAVRK